jgi:phosphate:Na+ symporter
MNYAGIIISFLGSLGLFLFGMTVLSSALQKTAGSKMKQLLGRMSKSRFRGVLFGAGVTAVIQSSTATTVMAVGFVNAGIISLTQIVGIIMGANIGSTTTSWLVSSVEWAAFLRPAYIGAVFAAGGSFALLLSKKEKVKDISKVFAGFGVLFIGLSQMPEAVKPITELDAIRDLFTMLGNNPPLALLAGMLVTGIIQSSGASIGILQSMAVTGMIPWSAAVFIVLGQNVGTCFTTMLTSIGTNRNTRAASFVHFVYNAVGAVVFSIGAFIFFTFVNPAFGAESASSTNVSMIHTGYNVLLLLLLFPLGSVIMKLALKMAGEEKPQAAGACELTELDESILETPAYALENSVKAVHKLKDILRINIELSSRLFMEQKLNEAELKSFQDGAADADKANAVIRSFLTKLYGEDEKLAEAEHVFIATILHNLTRLERINDHTKGIVRKAEELHNESFTYSEEITRILRDLSAKAMLCYTEAVSAFMQNKPADITITDTSDEIQAMYEQCKARHLERVSNAEYSIQSGTIFLEVARHLSRIGSNSKSIAENLCL